VGGQDEEVHELRIGSRPPTNVVKHRSAEIVPGFYGNPCFPNQEEHCLDVAATAGKVKETLAVPVARIEALALVKKLAELVHVSRSNCCDRFHCVATIIARAATRTVGMCECGAPLVLGEHRAEQSHWTFACAGGVDRMRSHASVSAQQGWKFSNDRYMRSRMGGLHGMRRSSSSSGVSTQ
jgi:hypothetical protein